MACILTKNMKTNKNQKIPMSQKEPVQRLPSGFARSGSVYSIFAQEFQTVSPRARGVVAATACF